MKTTEFYGGNVCIQYAPADHPHLFNRRVHPQQPSYPTEDVLAWLQARFPETYWGMEQFHNMRIVFPDKETAMLFKLTFA